MLLSNTTHFLNGHDMISGYPEGAQQAYFGMGCFWGVERIFWQLPGVYVTSVGYQGGSDTAPDYRKVCTGATGHTEAVHIVFDPKVISYEQLLKVFFEHHDPTQGNRQGNDVGSQYRSAIYYTDEAQRDLALASKEIYAAAYAAKGHGAITTEIAPAPKYYVAEDYHQQYLAKNPGGYCNHGPTGVSCPIPTRVTV